MRRVGRPSTTHPRLLPQRPPGFNKQEGPFLRSSAAFPELGIAAVILSRTSTWVKAVLQIRVSEVIGSTGVAELDRALCSRSRCLTGGVVCLSVFPS